MPLDSVIDRTFTLSTAYPTSAEWNMVGTASKTLPLR
jgi:hypothetical protein